MIYLFFLTNIYFYPAPDRGTGYLNRAISLFVSLFLCQQDYEKTAGPIAWNFQGGVEWPWDDLIQFWVNSGKLVAPETPQNGDLDN